jgi:chromate reductase
LIKSHDGVNVKFIDLADYDMPIYNGDLEEAEGMPEKATAFKKHLEECDGFFITSPEYNGFFTPLLKNALDWATRPHNEADKNDREPYKDKVAAIAACSPGGTGGMRGLPHLRTYLSGIGTHVIPMQTAVGNGMNNLGDTGAIQDDNLDNMFKAEIEQFVKTVKAL